MASPVASSDEVIKHILREIVARSSAILKLQHRAAGNDATTSTVNPVAGITETLAAFMVRATVLDPRNAFRLDQDFGKTDIDRLVKSCVDRITTHGDPEAETMKMQVYFDTTFPLQADYLSKEKLSRRNTLASLLREIIETRQIKTIQSLESLYHKIVTYVLIKSSMGSALDVLVVRETTVALESIFPQAEVSTFLNISRPDKEKQLNGMTQLVSGIRLFNKHIGKSDAVNESIANLPEMCTKELEEVTKLITEEIARTEKDIQHGTAVLEKNEKPYQMDAVVHRDLTSTLIFRRQILIYLDALIEQLFTSKKVLHNLADKYNTSIDDLKNTVKARSAIPVDQVYPLFMSLAIVWDGYQDELFVLAMRRGIADTLLHGASVCPLNVSSEAIAEATSYIRDVEPKPLNDKDTIATATQLNYTLQSINKSVEVMHPGNSAQYYKLPVEYGGFCSVTCTQHGGLVLPGDWNLGIIKYKDRLYAFATADAAKRFIETPEHYIESILQLAREIPSLVQLLQLYGYFPSIEALERAQSFTRQMLLGQKPVVCETGTQTDLHIVDTYIDPKYEWNEWTMRKKALMLVNLRTKKTHSTQTNSTHFKRDSETQCYGISFINTLSESQTQTRRENATSTTRHVQYISGLRGGTLDTPPKMKVVDATLDL